MVGVYQSPAGDGGDGKMISESVGILKHHRPTGYQRLSVVHKAVIVAESLEKAGVDQPCRAEPAAGEVDVGD